MTWYGWLALAAGVFGYAQTWRRLAYVFAWEFKLSYQEVPETFECVVAGIVAAIVSPFWPLIVPAYYATRLNVGAKLIVPPPHVRREQRAARIQELERLVGIDDVGRL